MHEDDRKFWAEQARKEREASQGRTYTPAAPSKSRTGRQPRKKASTGSNVRYCPMIARAHDPVDERMDDIVKLIIAGKTGDEIGGELQRKKPSVSVSHPIASVSVEASSVSLSPLATTTRLIHAHCPHKATIARASTPFGACKCLIGCSGTSVSPFTRSA